MSGLRILPTPRPCVAVALGGPDAAAPVDQAGWAERKRTVRLPNGLRLAYVELGDPDGPPLLLLHGYTDSSRVWTILAPQLGRYRMLIPDQRGHGASDAPACCYTMEQLAEDARLFLDAMGVERAAVAGHSMGSMVAQVLAAEHPDQVTRLVLVGSTALPAVRRGDWLWTQVMALREPIASNADFLRAFGPDSSPTPVDPDLLRFYAPEIAATPPHVWRSMIRQLVEVPIGRYAPDVRAPVLILSGGRDELFPAEHHAALVAAYPRAEAHVFPELGHNLIIERPEEVGPVLVRFLDAGPPAEALDHSAAAD
ncbi:alpha/beta fold hydrolase [Sphingosinicella sp. CPCC 101087]|uniref:alpha/beta fold hydrolase n=1 Tax=Sphingosinicella sp. CPCC 101087 TaxID=2497754 RepID=UPI00101CD075|nr:alpha/beta hydrolase [Sphingosinicella sp. CPCC 101087]